jgi:hypothetical protein
VRTDTQSKLDAILRRQRLGRAAAIVLALVIGAGIFYIQSQPNRSERELEAVVVKAFIDETPEGKRFPHIEGQLAAGKIVVVAGHASVPPAPGTRLVVRERVTWLGFHSYEWNGETR